MRRIHYLPLELMDQRFSGMMNAALIPHVTSFLYPGKYESREIKNGEFLDIIGTNQFKAQQLELVTNLFREGKVKDGDVFLVGDIFFPGIPMIQYMAELLGIEVYLAGFNYAGRADPTDFVQKLGPWADAWEKSIHDLFPLVFVGSAFHQRQVMQKFRKYSYITGYLWDSSYAQSIHPVWHGDWVNPDYVIWPHRICEEKGINTLYEIAAKCPHHTFVITSCGPERVLPGDKPANIQYLPNLSKKDYYKVLDECQYYLSTAYQETFGYTIQEAMLYGCRIVAPNRACYPEMVSPRNLYQNVEEAVSLLNSEPPLAEAKYAQRWDKNVEQVIHLINSEI